MGKQKNKPFLVVFSVPLFLCPTCSGVSLIVSFSFFSFVWTSEIAVRKRRKHIIGPGEKKGEPGNVQEGPGYLMDLHILYSTHVSFQEECIGMQ